eukprot:TRINITY_DN5143_c0_g1_i1.p1 TRINITY_DN5143_c0_g1~~TRINITY_DN5143_c0_g1_i1.p1  ORF type:complete len:843 (+),score=179.65 TRINITY_DN5143_c0_g1_i1:107-2635(+)
MATATPPEVRSELEFVSIGCNRLANVAEWCPDTMYVAYGAGSFVCLYDVSCCKLLRTLPDHSSRVNCVRWLGRTRPFELLSGSTDGLIIHSKYSPESNTWEVKSKLKGHSNSVTSLSVIETVNHDLLLASSSADKTVKIWWLGSGDVEWKEIQTISFGGKFVETIALCSLPNTNSVVLAAGGVDALIHLFILNLNNKESASATSPQFTPLLKLSGHDDWIRSLAFATVDNGDLLLASSSQDTYIRLWRIAKLSKEDPLLIQFSQRSKNASSALSQKAHLFKLSSDLDLIFAVTLESVLSGHEEWVYSVCWHPLVKKADGSLYQPLCLLSASMDKTMMIWTPEEKSGLWINEVRVGELGGNTLGFYGGLYGKDGEYILAHAYNGAFHCWQRTPSTTTTTKQTTGSESHRRYHEDDAWEPILTVSGHFDQVMDISWSPRFDFLLSVSADQTTRVFAKWRHPKVNDQSSDASSWHEIARPQIHGHDLNCIAFLPNTCYTFFSGADEKVIRVFEATRMFLESLQNITGVDMSDILSQSGEEDAQKAKDHRALGANVPPLGLSNKPVYSDMDIIDTSKDGYEDENLIKPAPPVLLHRPPLEDLLLQSTLWPETQKLYGHGNELVCVCSDHSGEFIASACRATTADQAAIRVWNAKKWKEECKLLGHTLTVTQLQFSHSDDYLLSCSRDRDFTVFKKTPQGFVLAAKVKKAHERIIWGCSWSPDDKFLLTASRDKTVKIWRWENEQVKLAFTLPTFSSAATAVSCAETRRENEFMFAVGLESGSISIWKATTHTLECSLLHTIPREVSHIDTVRKLCWKPISPDTGSYELASCSTDQSLRIFTLTSLL